MKERKGVQRDGGKKKGKGRNKSEVQGEGKEGGNGWMGKEEKKGGKEGIEGKKKQFQKIPALETKLHHNTLNRRELRHQQKTHNVISWCYNRRFV